MSHRRPSTPTATRPAAASRRFPLAVYLTGIAVVLTAFLLEITRGECPVP